MKWSLLVFLTVLVGSCGGDVDDPVAAQPPVVDPGPDPEPDPKPDPGPAVPLTWVEQDSGTEFDFSQVTAVDADHAWAVARDRIYRTVDGGATWVEVGMDFPGYISDLKFFDPLNGWALVSHHLYSTSDGGDTWVERASLASGPYFEKMSFIDMNTGWVALSRNEIWRTTDGGDSWTTSTFAPSVGSRWVAAVEFADSQVGWILTYNLANSVAGAEVLNTTDGGATWTPQLAIASSGTYLSDIAPVSPTMAWVVGEDDGEIIFATTDGGSTWVEQERNTFSIGLRGVHFLSVGMGWAAGIKIRRTIDGGATWTFENMPQLGFADVHFVDSTTGWAVGQGGMILKSTVSAAPAPQPLPQTGWVPQESGSLSDMSCVSAVDAEQAWAMGVYGSCTDLLRIQDGGSAWSFMGPGSYYLGFSVHPTVSQIHFLDSQTGFRNNCYTLERTEDGGQTWEVKFSSLVARLSSMSWISPTTGWIAHLNGGLSKTTDGGETWDGLPLPSGIGYMGRVKFVDEDVGWITVLGSSGPLFKTVDGGQTWSQQLNSIGSIRDLFAISRDRAWIVGTQGDSELIMATTDGTTWAAQSLEESDDLQRVFFVDADNGWAVGQQIHRTTDGGATWTVQPTAQEGFSDVVFVDALTGWVVGDNGVILKTTTGGE